jgi:hypothetical protein
MREERESGTRAGRRPGIDSQAETLAACLEGREASSARANLTEEERSELASLLELADQLDARMVTVRPSPVFVRSLGRELVEEAERRLAKREKRHRIAVISAAVAGGVVSIVSLVGGIVVLVKWLRTRTEARQASTA